MKTILTSLSLAIALCASAQIETPSDSVTIIKNANVVTVTANENKIGLNVKNVNDSNSFSFTSQSTETDNSSAAWDIDLPFLHNQPKKFKTIGFDNAFVGFTSPIDGADGLNGSWEIGVPTVIGGSWHPAKWISFSIGIGFTYSRLNVGDGKHLYKKNGILKITDNTPEMGEVNSKIEMTNFTVPINWKLYPYRGWLVQLGAWPTFNTFTSATTFSKANDIKYENVYRGLQQRIFTVQLFGSIGFSEAIGLYVKYSPMSVFKKGYGPDTKLLSFGININI